MPLDYPTDPKPGRIPAHVELRLRAIERGCIVPVVEEPTGPIPMQVVADRLKGRPFEAAS
jgi:hypothetical protein